MTICNMSIEMGARGGLIAPDETTFEYIKGRRFAPAGEAWEKAIATDKLTWTQVSDLQFWNNAAAVLYRVRGIPYNFLVDPNGKIIAKNLRGEELIATLSTLLNKEKAF